MNPLFRPAAVLSLFIALAPVASAVQIPANDGFITDGVGIITEEQDAELEKTLTDYQALTSNEIAVVIVRNMSGASIADTATELLRRWGVGAEGKDNGIVMLIDYENREMFIATGYGLEGAVPDIAAKGIGQKDIVPHFREGEYYEGILAGIDALKRHIGGEYTADRYENLDQEGGGSFAWILFFVFIGFDALAALFGRTKSWWLGGVVGGGAGLLLTLIYGWWLSIPVLVAIGLGFDYIVSKSGYKGGRGGSMGPFMGGGRGGRGGSSFRGFGGGSGGGGGARIKW